MRPTVAFDGSVLTAPQPTGVALAFRHALTAYAAADPGAILLLPPGASSPRIAGLEVVHTPAVAGAVARRVVLPRVLHRLGIDVLHAPFAAVPPFAPCAVVATIHDLPWRAVPPLRERGAGLRARLVTRTALARADVAVVPSQSTADDIAAWLGSPRAEVIVVPHGVPLPAESDGTAAGGPFLVLADERPRKNLPRLRAAHRRAAAVHEGLPPLQHIGPGRRYLSEAEKHHALRCARAVLLVSLHEGFGLPVIEAFGHGIPVLCSDRKSLPEIAGDAALMVDPEDEVAIAAAIVRIHTDEPLRERLRAAGRTRAARYTPDRTAAAWRRIHARFAR